MASLLGALLAATLLASGARAVEYPLFKQCDAAWGEDLMVDKTICQVGCLMTSVAMALRGYNVSVDGAAATPATLNTWLQHNGGYVDGNDLEEASLDQLQGVVWPSDGMHLTNDLNAAQIAAMLARGRVVIANVLAGEHFVLVTGLALASEDALTAHKAVANRISGPVANRRLAPDAGGAAASSSPLVAKQSEVVAGVAQGDVLVLVNDPGFDTSNYSLTADVVGWRVFDMS